MDPARPLLLIGSLLALAAALLVLGSGPDAGADEPPAAARAPAPKPPAVRIERGVVFGKGGETDLLLDLYHPPASFTGARPAVIWIHGGGWRAGSRRAGARYGADLARCGFVVASIDYRLAPAHRFPAAVEDCKCAVRWVRANAERLNVDATRLAAVGTSAGGHLALMLGVAGEEAGLEGTGGNAEVSSHVHAVVSGFGPAELGSQGGAAHVFAGDQTEEASPVTYASKDDPPVLMLHGDDDRVVPVSQSEKMKKALDDAGGKATLIVEKGAPHGYWNRPEHRVTVLAVLATWLRRTLDVQDAVPTTPTREDPQPDEPKPDAPRDP